MEPCKVNLPSISLPMEQYHGRGETEAEIVAHFKGDGTQCAMFIVFDRKLLFVFHSRK